LRPHAEGEDIEDGLERRHRRKRQSGRSRQAAARPRRVEARPSAARTEKAGTLSEGPDSVGRQRGQVVGDIEDGVRAGPGRGDQPPGTERASGRRPQAVSTDRGGRWRRPPRAANDRRQPVWGEPPCRRAEAVGEAERSEQEESEANAGSTERRSRTALAVAKRGREARRCGARKGEASSP
jgi:hypothetical protein